MISPMDNSANLNLTHVTDTHGGMRANPDFTINAMMDGPQVRDGNTGELRPGSATVNGAS